MLGWNFLYSWWGSGRTVFVLCPTYFLLQVTFFRYVGLQLPISQEVHAKFGIFKASDIYLTIFFPLTIDNSGILPDQLFLTSSTHGLMYFACNVTYVHTMYFAVSYAYVLPLAISEVNVICFYRSHS